MASPAPTAAAAVAAPAAQVVGNAFVHQYYHILHQSPEFVFRFYLEGSKLGRPDNHGVMSAVTGMEDINQKILSLDYSQIRAEIKTVDAQESLEGGVLVLVTGYLTGKDDVRKNFTQSFFLAPQDKGYYVLNDIFRYVEESDPLVVSQVSAAVPEEETPSAPEQQVLERSVPPEVEEEDEVIDEEDDEVIDEELFNPSDHEDAAVAAEEEIPVEEVIDGPIVINNSSPVVVEQRPVVAAVQEDAPKKSYASIVKVKKENVTHPSAPVATPARPAPSKPVRQAAPAPVPALTPEAPAASSNSTETSSILEAEVDSHSVYIKNLPLSATPDQLEEEFKKFGAIKINGIQVRSHKQGFCFGFVEFEEATSVQSAIGASPISISGRPAYVEEKRPAGSRVGNRGRFVSGRGGYWNDSVRGRGNFGGRGYGRSSEYGSRADFGGRGTGRGGVSNRGGEGGYQRVDSMGSNGGGRGNRSGPMAANGPSRAFAPRVPAPA